ncbi:MAG TPA: ABC transporter ATP-binding protein [Bryobacteraceae bacterium]|nr:ABC transporter ATP-binding protein [Bryobacteraceae bacterium]
MNSPLRCERLSKRFGQLLAIRDLQFDLPDRSIYALVGPNGAGKTTLIKMLVNILRPTSGRCVVLDTDSRRLSPNQFAQIGYVSENQEMPEWMTVDYFLAYLKPFYPTWDDALAEALLRDFQLPGGRRLSELSRGMKMKAALASSLAYHPRLIFLDEPFSGLDALVRQELIEGLLERAEDTTVLVSSHDLADIETFASHIGFLDSGQLQFSEEATTLTQRFREIEVTLRTPPTLPSNWPESWSNAQTSDSMVRFVESRFDSERTQSAIAHFFPAALHVSMNPMPLRDIFVALARQGRRSALRGEQS